MLRPISPNVFWWVEMHGEARGEPYTWNSHLVRIEEEGVIALVDPLPLSADEIREVEETGTPTHILLTCNYHLREADAFRDRWGSKILLQKEQLPEAETAIDGTLEDGDLLWGRIEVIRVPDVRFPEELAFLVRSDDVLIVGDAVCGGRMDRGIPEGEIRIPLPGLFYFPEGPRDARDPLRRVLDFPFSKMCFAHGSPVLDEPKAALRRFLEDEAYWDKLRKAHRERTF